MGQVLAVVALIAALAGCVLWIRAHGGRREARAAFIARYRFPAPLRDRIRERRPGIDERQVELVLAGLRQYFLACHDQERHGIARHVGIPSKAVEEARHEFSRMTREYDAFCRRAFGSSPRHLALRQMDAEPDEVMANTLHLVRSRQAQGAAMAAVPLLFAVDRELGLRDGHLYDEFALAPLEARRDLLLHPPPMFETNPGMSDSSCGGGGDGGGGDS